MGGMMKRYGWIAVAWMGCQRLEVVDGPGPNAEGGESGESSASSGSSGGGSDDGDPTTSTTAPDSDAQIPGCTGEPPDVELMPDTHASCSGVPCACDEVCVVSDEYCGASGWFEPSAHCVVLPPECTEVEGAQAQGCLSDMVCEGGLWVEEWMPARGVLSCVNPGQDCEDDTDDTA
jgi:hypothetical protein